MKHYVMDICRALPLLWLIVASAGCAEAKIGMGPFKAGSVEVGPGGVEAKGPSAGPISAGKVESGEKDDD